MMAMHGCTLEWKPVSSAVALTNKGGLPTVQARCLQSTLDKIPAMLASGDAQPQKSFIFSDKGAAPSRTHCSLNKVCCITKSRAEQHRLVVLKGPKFDAVAELSVDCMAFCQGWSPARLATLRRRLPDAKIAGALGNAIALPFLREFAHRSIPRIID